MKNCPVGEATRIMIAKLVARESEYERKRLKREGTQILLACDSKPPHERNVPTTDAVTTH
jgi:hypothetical protein